MSLVSGLQPIFIPLTFPSTAGGTAIIRNNIYNLNAGVYMVTYSYSIRPETGGANITYVSYTLSQTDPNTAVVTSVLELHNNNTALAGVNATGSNTNIAVIPKNNTSLTFSTACGTSAGNWSSANSVLDVNYTKLTFIKIA